MSGVCRGSGCPSQSWAWRGGWPGSRVIPMPGSLAPGQPPGGSGGPATSRAAWPWASAASRPACVRTGALMSGRIVLVSLRPGAC